MRLSKRVSRLHKNWSDFLNLLYQWLATILMWCAIASNFSHIKWYIEKHAVEKDWTAFVMALIVEAGIGLSIHHSIACVRAALLSKGQITDQDKRFNKATVPIFFSAALFLGIFSGVCNTKFFGGNILLGSIAPVLTIAFAALEAAKELLVTKRGALAKSGQIGEKPGQEEVKPAKRSGKPLPTSKRRDKVFALYSQDLDQNPADLGKRFGVSAQTIRNDLVYLAKQGKIIYKDGRVTLRPQKVVAKS